MFAQTSSGMRQKFIPGARMVMIVTRKLMRRGHRRPAGELHPEVEERLAERRPGGQRRVAGPAGVERPTGQQEAADEQEAGEGQHPEAERVQARERHVRRPDHQRQHVVGDPREHGDHEDEDHDRGVRREQPVEGAGLDDLGPGLRQLGAHDHRHRPADEEEDEGGADVLDPDHLVIGVELEVVLPRVRAVILVLELRRVGGPADRPAEPVVEGAEPGEEADRGEDRGNDHLGVARLLGLEGRQPGKRPQQHHQPEAERPAEQRARAPRAPCRASSAPLPSPTSGSKSAHCLLPSSRGRGRARRGRRRAGGPAGGRAGRVARGGAGLRLHLLLVSQPAGRTRSGGTTLTSARMVAWPNPQSSVQTTL